MQKVKYVLHASPKPLALPTRRTSTSARYAFHRSPESDKQRGQCHDQRRRAPELRLQQRCRLHEEAELKKNRALDVTENEQSSQDAPCTGVTGLDVSRYSEYVKDFELDEEQQTELLQTLWWIMATFVDLGFGVDSVQRCLPALAEMSSETAEDEVKSKVHDNDLNDAGLHAARGTDR
jgi:hypothetical protein